MLLILYRILVWPLSLIYRGIVGFRNLLYDKKIYSSLEYDITTIGVGNLSMGGTGKTPMVEYLIKFLSNNYNIATLSRGYKRDTVGFRIATEEDTASSLGDEPLQYFKKFKNITVAVAEKRAYGVAELIGNEPDIQVIILDDVYQHRALKCGLYLLISDYNNLFYNDYLIPMGRLREPASNANRAHAIIISKCPENISIAERAEIKAKCLQYSNAPVFFSHIKFDLATHAVHSGILDYNEKQIILITGIAKPKSLLDFLESTGAKVIHSAFADHHAFTENDLHTILNGIKKANKTATDFNWLTTEKDFMRLLPFENFFKENNINLFIQGISFEFDSKDTLHLQHLILENINRHHPIN